MESVQHVPEMTVRYMGKHAQGQDTVVVIGPVAEGIAIDRSFPYASWTDALEESAYDSPGCPAAAGIDPLGSTDPITELASASFQATFQHYLMFKPGRGGVPVALRRADWTLSMAATNAQSHNLLDTLVENACSASLTADNVLVSGNPTWSNHISGFFFSKDVFPHE